MDIVEFTKKSFENFFKKEFTAQDKENLLNSVTTLKKSIELASGNLENDELLGDKFLQYVFVKYCFTRHPFYLMRKIKNAQTICSRLVIKYLRTGWLHWLCVKIGLSKYIQCSLNQLSFASTCEDVLESWIGCCVLIYGSEKVEKFLFDKFDLFKIDFTSYEALYDSKTRLNDFLSKLKYRLIKFGPIWVDGEESGYQVRVYSTMDTKLIGHGFSPDDEMEAEIAAASDLLKQYKIVMGVEFYNTLHKIGSFKIWKEFYDEFQENLNKLEDKKDKTKKRSHVD